MENVIFSMGMDEGGKQAKTTGFKNRKLIAKKNKIHACYWSVVDLEETGVVVWHDGDVLRSVVTADSYGQDSGKNA